MAMLKKHELPNMDKRCRICLVDHGCMTTLQDEHVEAKLKDLSKCTSINVKHDANLPSCICHVCLYKLNMWREFKEQFVQSNKILLGQLEVSDVSDNLIQDSQHGKHCKENMKRKHSDESTEDTATADKKKSKTEVSPSDVDHLAPDQAESKTIHTSDNDTLSVTKDPVDKVISISEDDDESKKNVENENEEHIEGRSSSGPTRMKLLPGRRGRTNERRRASTKRWVERKKALLAATGNISDTDSVGSDDVQLSPVQKARVKTHADKEAERQKRVAKVLKSLETHLTEKFMIRNNDHNIGDTDSDVRRTRLRNSSNISQESNKNLLVNRTDKQDSDNKNKTLSQEKVEKENSVVPLLENNTVVNDTGKSKSQVDEMFTPYSLKSELIIGNVTYVVTSTLIPAEPQYLNKGNINNITKDSKSLNIDENSQEKNTDIIDAVQLRRIHPVASNLNNKRPVERCLNIEVESSEVDALKRVQIELASFVKNEITQRLYGTSDGIAKTDKTDNAYTNSYQKLDYQLKNIVEKAIRKNIQVAIMRDTVDTSKICAQKSARISPTFVKIASNSSKYQPKVMLKRLDITKESKLYRINNIHALNKSIRKCKLAGPFSAIARKRQSVLPIRYNDYNTSALDSDSNVSDDVIFIPETLKVTTTNTRTYGSALKSSSATNNQLVTKLIESSAIKPVGNNITSAPTPISQNSPVTNEQQPNQRDITKIESNITENHICGVCALSFDSRKEVEAHVRTHKVANTENAMPRHNKHKMMRCKRCQEIVEARYVKVHVCKTNRQNHKCYVCNSMFRTEQLLVRHLESHDQSEFSIENVTKIESKKPSNIEILQKTKQTVPAILERNGDRKTDKPMSENIFLTSQKVQNILVQNNDNKSDTIVATVVKSNNANAVVKTKETYTCFVCDKIFTDEDILKDHLQKHCDDLSEGEQSTCKEQYQCAICGDTLDSDQALEEHVGKHLFDDEDDNPNLISIGHDEDKMKNVTYQCRQCLKKFDSEMLLEMHMPAHEEEAAIAEWEKQGMKIYQYQCLLCDELFDAEVELTEHLDVHNENAQVCQLCDKPFRTLEDLQKHVATH